MTTLISESWINPAPTFNDISKIILDDWNILYLKQKLQNWYIIQLMNHEAHAVQKSSQMDTEIILSRFNTLKSV